MFLSGQERPGFSGQGSNSLLPVAGTALSLIGALPPGLTGNGGPGVSRLNALGGLATGNGTARHTMPQHGEPGYDPDPGFHFNPGPSTAVPMPDASRMEIRPDFLGARDKPGTIDGVPGARDWVYRGERVTARNLPAYDSDHNVQPSPRVEYASVGQPENSFDSHGNGDFRPSPPQAAQPGGPAKASRFIDPKTGKFDYWGWLDAGMANLGKGGTLFEDDTPDIMERNAILDRPAAMIAAGAPENARMPDESRFEGAKDGQDGLARPVAMKAGGESPSAGQQRAASRSQTRDRLPPPLKGNPEAAWPGMATR